MFEYIMTLRLNTIERFPEQQNAELIEPGES